MHIVRAGLIVVVLVAAGCLSSCGGGADQEARAVQKHSIVAKASPLTKVLVSDREVADAHSASRALLSYWSALQYQAWDDAALSYDKSMRDFIGAARLQNALANQVAYYRSAKPTHVRTRMSEGRAVTVYEVVDAKGNSTPASTTWQREGGRWAIVHDWYLDSALAQAAQLDLQTKIDPT